jgi:MFS family permease
VRAVASETAGTSSADAETESGYAWLRLAASVLISTIGGVGMWSVIVSLPVVQAEFGVARGEASLPYTFVMIGCLVGSVLMGRLSDRFGILVPVLISTVSLSAGYMLASRAEALWQFGLIHGVLLGLLGSSGTFSPVIADISLWFNRRRGMAVAICACGSYLAGTFWPPVVQRLTDAYGWRDTHFMIAVFCLVTLLPLSLILRRRAPVLERRSVAAASPIAGPLRGLSPNAVQSLLMIAGVACCVAMSMPQVHIVAYCVDLGFGTARGAEMLSLMLATGIVSRLASGWISDRIGPFPTLLLGSALQALSLLLYLPFDGLVSLYIVSGLFGLFQGGIVPSYAVIVREIFPPSEAGTRISLVLSATLGGMALGGWLSGAIFDFTLNYHAAFLNGIAWNLINITIVLWLMQQLKRGRRSAALGSPAVA